MMPEAITPDRRRFLSMAATAMAATRLGKFGSASALVQQLTPAAFQPPRDGALDALDSATGGLNSRPLSSAGLRGTGGLLDFSTYPRITWLPTLPYVRALAAKD